MKARINLFALFTADSGAKSINKLTGSHLDLDSLDKNESEVDLTTCAPFPRCWPISVLGFKSFEAVMEVDSGYFSSHHSSFMCHKPQ